MDNYIDLVETISDLTYKEKRYVISRVCSLGTFSSDTVEDKLMLISLISTVYMAMKKKDRNITPLKILLKITNQKEDKSAFYNTLEILSLMVEEFSYNCTVANTYGLKTSADIINKIKEILSAWIPF